jgi:hypothetical protein
MLEVDVMNDKKQAIVALLFLVCMIITGCTHNHALKTMIERALDYNAKVDAQVVQMT